MRSPLRFADRAFLVLLILYLAPLWTFEFVPTQDGPSHVYNALIISNYANQHDYPLYRQHYVLNVQAMPNMAGHLILAGLMQLFDPLVAEKLLLSMCVVGFLAGGRRLILLIRPGQRLAPLLLFPAVYCYVFQMGYYNFCLGMVAFLWGMVYCVKHDQRFTAKHAAVFTAIAAITFFCHFVAVVMLLTAAGTLRLLKHENMSFRKCMVQLLYLFPAAILPLWFYGSYSLRVRTTEYMNVGEAITQLLHLRTLISMNQMQQVLANATAIVLAVMLVLSAITLRRRWRGWSLSLQSRMAIATVLIMCVYLISPARSANNHDMHVRIAMYVYLVLLPCIIIRPRGRRGRLSSMMLTSVLIVLALVHWGVLMGWYKVLNDDLKQFTSGLQVVERNRTIMPLIFDRQGPASPVRVFQHAVDHYCIYTGGIDVTNYEANSPYFPVQMRAKPARLSMADIELYSPRLPIEDYAPHVDVIVTWAMPQGYPPRRAIEKHYALIFESERLRIYQRRS